MALYLEAHGVHLRHQSHTQPRYAATTATTPLCSKHTLRMSADLQEKLATQVRKRSYLYWLSQLPRLVARVKLAEES